jgi:hypothetical protein
MFASKNKVKSAVLTAILVVGGLFVAANSVGCDSYYDPYWDINSAAWYRQAETDYWADMWDYEILYY